MTSLLRNSRAQIAFFHDVAMAALSFLASFYLRVGDAIVYYPVDYVATGTVLFTAVAAGVFASLRLYRGVWGYASLNDMLAIAKAVTLTLLVFLPAMFLVTRLSDLPRSLLVINWFVLLALLAGPRILYRILKDRSLSDVLSRDGHRRVPVVVVGAGDRAELFLRAMAHGGAGYRVVGLVDDRGSRIGRRIHGIEVMGGLADIDAVLDRLANESHRPRRIVVASSLVDGPALRRLVEAADRRGLSVARLPQITDFQVEDPARIEVRPVAIEDLLGRPQAVLDRDAMRRLVAGRRVAVTGAGGTIGGELSRQIAALGPARLVLLDHSEYALYAIDLEIADLAPGLARGAALADVRDRGRILEIFRTERPELVFHAAALKHVPIAEAHPREAVLTNAVGTRIVAEACRECGAAAMVLISTDKAVNPTNVMGATKRLAESWCQALDLAGAAAGGTRFLAVRFGNVLGSTGSVVPLFQRQLAAGGPVTVTHPEMTRYFMTTREAVELVLQASALGAEDPEAAGKLFVLDMGEPVRILDLAKQMIRLAGFTPDREVKIAFTGLRPGEKLYEELFHEGESHAPSAREGILIAAPRPVDLGLLSRALDELEERARAGAEAETLALLRRLVPEFAGAPPRTSAAAR